MNKPIFYFILEINLMFQFQESIFLNVYLLRRMEKYIIRKPKDSSFKIRDINGANPLKQTRLEILPVSQFDKYELLNPRLQTRKKFILFVGSGDPRRYGEVEQVG